MSQESLESSLSQNAGILITELSQLLRVPNDQNNTRVEQLLNALDEAQKSGTLNEGQKQRIASLRDKHTKLTNSGAPSELSPAPVDTQNPVQEASHAQPSAPAEQQTQQVENNTDLHRLLMDAWGSFREVSNSSGTVLGRLNALRILDGYISLLSQSASGLNDPQKASLIDLEAKIAQLKPELVSLASNRIDEIVNDVLQNELDLDAYLGENSSASAGILSAELEGLSDTAQSVLGITINPELQSKIERVMELLENAANKTPRTSENKDNAQIKETEERARTQISLVKQFFTEVKSLDFDPNKMFPITENGIIRHYTIDLLLTLVVVNQTEIEHSYQVLQSVPDSTLKTELFSQRAILEELRKYIEIFKNIDAFAQDVSGNKIDRAAYDSRRAQLELQISSVTDPTIKKNLTERLSRIQAPQESKNVNHKVEFIQKLRQIKSNINVLNTQERKWEYLDSIEGIKTGLTALEFIQGCLLEYGESLSQREQSFVNEIIELVKNRNKDLAIQNYSEWENLIGRYPWVQELNNLVSIDLNAINQIDQYDLLYDKAKSLVSTLSDKVKSLPEALKPVIEKQNLYFDRLNKFFTELSKIRDRVWITEIAQKVWIKKIESLLKSDLSALVSVSDIEKAIINLNNVLNEFEVEINNLPSNLTPISDREKQYFTDRRNLLLQLLERLQALKLLKDNEIKIDKFRINLNNATRDWQTLKERIPANRKEMRSRGLSLKQMNALREDLISEYQRIDQTGILKKTGDEDIDREITQFVDNAKGLIEFRTLELLKLPDPKVMSIEEVVEELTTDTAIYDSDRFLSLKNRYEAALSEETDLFKQSLLKDAVALTSAAIAGTSRKKDFASNLNRVLKPFAGDNGTMQTLAMLFYKESRNEVQIKDILENKVEIDSRAVQMWRYIIARIKHDPKVGGINNSGIFVERDQNNEVLFDDYSGYVLKSPSESEPAYQARLKNIKAAVTLQDRHALESLVPNVTNMTTEEYKELIDSLLKQDNIKPKMKISANAVVRQKNGETDLEYKNRLLRISEIGNQEFKYGSLNEHVVDDFVEFINLCFEDISSQRESILRNFFKTFGAKSMGYIPHLMRGTTRGHGFSPGEELKKDEAVYDNPYALRLYKATRYDRLTFARYMGRFMYMDKDQFIALAAQNYDKRNQLARTQSAEEFYELVELYYHSRFGSKLPLWITDSRKLFRARSTNHLPHIHLQHESYGLKYLWDKIRGKNHHDLEKHNIAEIKKVADVNIFDNAIISLDDSVFPLLPDFVANVMDLELQARELRRKLSQATTQAEVDNVNSDIDKFIEIYKNQGYFASGLFEELKKSPDKRDRMKMLSTFYGQRILLGGQESSNVTTDQYELAAERMEQMFDEIDKPMKADLGEAEAKSMMKNWCDGFIGKVKLIPGKHHLLFAPLTCEYLTNILHNYEKGHDLQDVNLLYRELMSKYIKAGGLPSYLYDEVVRLMGGNENKAPDYCIFAPRDPYRISYMRKLWEVENEENRSISYRLQRLIPFYSPKHSYRPPYEHEAEVGKDTTSGAKDEAKKH